MVRPRIRGIRLRLALALLLVVAGALGVVYLIVVPSLESELVNAKLDQLEEDANTVAPGLTTNAEDVQGFAEFASSVVQARVVIYTVVADQLFVYADSSTSSSLDVARDPVAMRAADTGKLQRGTLERGGRRFAQVGAGRRTDGIGDPAQ